MGRTVSFGVHQVKVKPRPLVGTRTFIKETEREMRNQEWSDGTGRFIVEALRDNDRERRGLPWGEVLNKTVAIEPIAQNRTEGGR